ncbi:hypothetical protein Taro_040991 [Colocasia esculenta]|uniref:F-box/kelch-repeat protein SKIP6 n=1 Tax=Colocasia esculenta TaxID=4460 RepID=A0A843WZK5_COLES|nr:hypothetical protein [Colocasia esculenta]
MASRAAAPPPSDRHAERDPVLPTASLLPQLPDDVSIQCIARVPRFFHARLAYVSRSWRCLLRSPALFAARLSCGAAFPFLCVDIRTTSARSSWFLLDREPRNPRPLLPLPPPLLPTAGSACATLGPLLFVIGGSLDGATPTTAVQVFDVRFRRWHLGPRMGSAREFAAAGAVGGRIYVVGGCLPSSEPWAEVLDPDSGRWAPMPSPLDVREKWMHGSVVLDGKLLAVADHGGLLFDPAVGTWGSVSTALDMGWKGRAAVVDGIIYSYDFLGNIKGFDPVMDEWREVEGVSEELPRFLSGAALAELGGHLCVLWEGKRAKRGKEMEIMCAAIKVSREAAAGAASSGKLRGKIVWTDAIALAFPKGSSVSHCLAVEV